LVAFSFMATAKAAPNPMVQMKSVTNQMLAALKKNRARLKRNPKYINRLVRRIVLPHADVKGMSRSVVGRTAWKSSSKSQQAAFSKAFTNVVIRTYASALNAYTDETVKFYPVRGGYQGKRRVEIHTRVIRSDGPPIPVNYRLALKKNNWKIYDLNVEGVGLLQSFYAQFQDELSRGKTLTQITRELRRRK